MGKDDGRVVSAHVRQATRQDVKTIAKLIRQLAEFENLTEICVFKDEELEEALFKLPPFQGPTVLLLEVTSKESPSVVPDVDRGDDIVGFAASSHEIQLDSPLVDEEEQEFPSAVYPDRVVVGYVLFFPNFSSFLAQVGFYIEDIYVRKPYRKKGFGTTLLRSVASEGVKHGVGRVEWCVLDWNINAIKFYEAMGATVMPEWRICRLTGNELQAYRS